MAKKKQPEQVDDPFGKSLEDAIRANQGFLEALKIEAANEAKEFAEGTGAMPKPERLLMIRQLELQLEADKMYAQARQMTRRRTSDG